MSQAPDALRGPGSRRALWLAVLLGLELAALAIVYQILTPFQCEATAAAGVCVVLRSFVARAITVLAAFALYAWARPEGIARLLSTRTGPEALPWLALHLAGVTLILSPLLFADGAGLDGMFVMALAPWGVGAIVAVAGALLWLAPFGSWLGWLRAERGLPLAVLAGALAVPDLAERMLPLWDIAILTRITFAAVEQVLRVAGTDPVVDAEAYLIGVDGFVVHIAHYCSGVEGFVLMTAFILLYAILFRHALRFPRYWIVVLPVALAFSWLLNVVRLAGLIAIGAKLSPDLAIGGFHSYAGWMFFTLLALALLAAVQAIPFLWVDAAPVPTPQSARYAEQAGPRILPFVAFMLASLVTSALIPVPDLAYPVKVAAMAGVLLAFAGSYRAMIAAPDAIAVVAGGAVGLFWLATRPLPSMQDAALADSLSGLAPVVLAGWIAFRLVGTILLVPLVEELFFRGYVLERLDGDTLARRLGAIAVSAGLFALLHGRWIAAGVAGVVFALTALRRGRLEDAVAAHMVANLVVAGWAFVRGDWAAI